MAPLKHSDLRYEILDTPPEPAFDDLARRAAEALGTTFAAISFFAHADANHDSKSPITREWFKASTGLPFTTLPSQHSFFLPALTASTHHPCIFVVPDALADKRFRDHPFVTGAPYLCFYVGCGILSAQGELLGVLSVFDTVSREIAAHELEALKNLAELVRARLEARIEAGRERRAAHHGSRRNETQGISAEQSLERLTGENLQLEQMLENEIAARKATETKLRYEKNFSDAALESLPGVFFMLDQDGRLVRWNERFEASTGNTALDVAKMHAFDFVSEPHRAVMADAIRRILGDAEEIAFEVEMRHKNGAASHLIPRSDFGARGAALLHRHQPRHQRAKKSRTRNHTRQRTPRFGAGRIRPRDLGLGS